MKHYTLEFVSLLFILLFVYAAVSKLLDLGIFQSQIAQSAMLAPYAKALAWLVPIIELLLAVLLFISYTRVWGLLGSAVLMFGFTIYVYLIWSYSPSLPCSCGGLLEAMDWETHLYFNLGFTLLATWAWYLKSGNKRNDTLLLIGDFGMLALVLTLFFTQPQSQILQDESFTRTYQKGVLEEIASQKLAFNSYYLAGVNDSLVYLGNSTGFTHGLVWNYKTGDTTHISVQLPDAPGSFVSSPKWQVYGDYFFIGEGVGPSLYRGKTSDWIAQKFMPAVPYYSDIVAIDTTEFIIRARQASTQKNVLATYVNREPYVQIQDVLDQDSGNLLQADGTLVWDVAQEQITYLYFYKNLINHWNRDFSNPQTTTLLYNLTINIRTRQGRDGTYLRETTYSPFHIKLRIWNNKYYVLSDVMGANESLDVFTKNSTIDIYDNNYLESIRIPNKNKERISDFYITDEHIIVHYVTQVVVYGH
ncbi:DoxX family protein [Gelidibacter gilvus]|uniref:DoxX family protein n=1 Tax=Gelidibacter gilvus TaxID=59602 RepID=UPI001CB92FFC|nr:DoxX family protein [Gelidibacter gilvus]